MKLIKLTVDNFRGYSRPVDLFIDDLTVLIGKNDAGKSTLLDALSIFFEEGKCDKDNTNISCDDGCFSITASFAPPQSMIIDATNPIKLKDEHLLDENGWITIKKTYSGGKLSKMHIIALHPDHDHLRGLLTMKIDQLKSLAQEIGIEADSIGGNKSMAATWRAAIRNHVRDYDLSNQEVLIGEKESKEIWEPIKSNLPVYALFKVDRNNHDQDSEVQDPFKSALKEILNTEEVKNAIQTLKSIVESAYIAIADATIAELRKLNPKIANQLYPSFGEPKIESAFKPEIGTDTGVPLNKRGSGVRRLVLLSFFKAAVMRRRSQESSGNIIYAIEEPETSQHPEHQQMLIQSLIEISQEDSAQVIFTTHSPQLVRELQYSTLRYIGMVDGHQWITSGEGVLAAAKADLGELPLITSGHLICVEGATDELFFRNIGKINELSSIFDISKASILPLNGGFIHQWAAKHYLQGTSVKEVHIYDKDSDQQYLDTASVVNSWDGCSAHLTTMREIENYIHPSLINDAFGTDFELNESWKDIDVPKLCADKSGRPEANVKYTICKELSEKMTISHLVEMNTLDELSNWFNSFKQAH